MTGGRWTVVVEAKGADGETERIEIATLQRDVSSPTPADLGLRLVEAKLRNLQSILVQEQLRQVIEVDRTCRCGSKRLVHDYRTRQVDTLFGPVILLLPRCYRSRTSALMTVEPHLSWCASKPNSAPGCRSERRPG